MRLKAFAGMILALLTLNGCAAMREAMERQERERIAREERRRENFRQSYCNYNGAYALGMNDGKERASMRVSVSQLCDVADKNVAEKGYREGYALGIKNAPSEIKIDDRRAPVYQYRPPVYVPPAYVAPPIYSPPSSQGNWNCSETVGNRTGSLEFDRCRDSSRRWACYQEIDHRCRDLNSGEVTHRKERRYTFCASSLSDCWR